jgi:hypothetical protein|tara:strand:- start:11305 stop:11787 length:483 start_codon:yes stop_codon:yes gene_type:complete
MILDERLEFCDDTDISASAGTALVGDVIDLEVARDIGGGQPIYLYIRTGGTEIITGGSAGTLGFKLASDSGAAISTSTSTIHLATTLFVTDGTDANAAEMKVGGTIFFGALPGEGDPYERYVGLLAVTATTTTTAGTINAGLTFDPSTFSSNKVYADATN